MSLWALLYVSLHSLGELKHREMRDASRHVNRWARDVLKIGEAHHMTYNAEGALVAEDRSSSASMFGSDLGSA